MMGWLEFLGVRLSRMSERSFHFVTRKVFSRKHVTDVTDSITPL